MEPPLRLTAHAIRTPQRVLTATSPLQIFWSDSGELVCIATEESFFILRYLADKVAASQENNEGVTEDGIEEAFEVGRCDDHSRKPSDDITSCLYFTCVTVFRSKGRSRR